MNTPIAAAQYLGWAYIHFWFWATVFFVGHNLVYPWWFVLFLSKRSLKQPSLSLFILLLLPVSLYANIFRFPDSAYFTLKRLLHDPVWSQPPEPILRDLVGTFALFCSTFTFTIAICWYDIPRCIGWGAGWYKARKSIAGKLGLFVRWGVIVPLLLFSGYLLWHKFLQTWNRVIIDLPSAFGELLRPMHPGCATTYLEFIGATWQVWLGFTLSLALGVYVAPRAWLRHLRTGAWSAVGRSTPLALLQVLLALYLVLVWPLRLTYGFVARVTCDARFLVPPPPLDTLFALLHPTLFWGAVGVLALLLWRCRHRGQCVPGLREAFPRWTGTSRKPLLLRRKPHDG